MTVLITGAGLIGQLTARLLAERGERVVLADIREPQMPLLQRTEFALCDVSDAARLREVILSSGATQIVHTAAMLSTGIRQDPVLGVKVNVMGTANVLECARTLGLGRVVLASSATVAYTTFGRHGATPIEEDVPLHLLSERPASIYAMTKIAGEQLAMLYADLYGVDSVVLRYAAVLGGGSEAPTSVPGRLLASLAAAGRSGAPLLLDDPFVLWGGREEFVDARDCAHANVCALDAAKPVQRVYNIAPGSWHTLDEFIAAMGAIYPRLDVAPTPELATGFAGFPHQRPAPSSTSAARAELSFACQHDLQDTMRFWAGPEAALHGVPSTPYSPSTTTNPEGASP
jgi:UDP-glucose 4-epimerase